MGEGQVRSVLWRHAAQHLGAPMPAGNDPTAFVPAAGFVQLLREGKAAQPDAAMGDAQLHRLAEDYCALWQRTFPALVRHLRGRPERALALFCEEVYPYLRGERRAARIESVHGRSAEVSLASDLPPAYLSGLLAAFVAVSNAHCTAQHAGGERFQVVWKIPAAERFARTAVVFAALRIPMLWTATAGALVVALYALGTAARAGAASAGAAAAIVVAGSLAAQVGANAIHDLRGSRLRGPLDAVAPPRRWAIVQIAAGYGIAAACLLYFLWLGRPLVGAFAIAGAATGFGYAALRDRGLGPILGGLAHGPLVVFGAGAAMGLDLATTWQTLAGPAFALGLATATIMFLDDLADGPIDQAAGRRTLAVRLPRRSHLMGFAALVAGTTLLPLAFLGGSVAATSAAIVTALLGAALVRRVALNLDDPRRLARPRLAAVGLHALAALTWLLILSPTPFP